MTKTYWCKNCGRKKVLWFKGEQTYKCVNCEYLYKSKLEVLEDD